MKKKQNEEKFVCLSETGKIPSGSIEMFLFVIFGPYHPSKQKKIGNLSIESQFSFLGHYAKVFSNS